MPVLFLYRELFSTVIDMLATLIHSTLVSDSQSEKGEENRKHYQNLMRKLKKVFGCFILAIKYYGPNKSMFIFVLTFSLALFKTIIYLYILPIFC